MSDTWLGAIQLTVIDLIAVFIVLWLLAIVIKGTQSAVKRLDRGREAGNDDETAEAETVAPDSSEQRPVIVPTARGYSVDTDIEDSMAASKLVAIVTAAVSSCMGDEAAPFTLRSITPVNGITTDAWLLAGRQRLMALRGMSARRR